MRTMSDALRLGLVADTHVPNSLLSLPDSLSRALSGADRILHAGDLVALSVLDQLGAIAPTVAVAGNCDPPDVARALPESFILSLGGHRIGLQHGHQRHALQNQYIGCGYDSPEFDLFYQAMAAQLPECDVIVFGHFHAPLVRTWRGILFVNPGSIAPPHARATCALLEIGNQATAHICLVA